MGPVKDFVRDTWRLSAACAAGAFVLSLVIGLIASNPFGVALGRAFLLGLLFAGLAAALRGVVKAFLPEMMGPAPQAAGAPAGGKAGAVDIVVPEDESLQREIFERPESRAPRGSQGSADEAAPEAGAADEEPAEVLDAPDDDDVAEEARALGALAEELGRDAGTGADVGAGGIGSSAEQSFPRSFAQGGAERADPGELSTGPAEPGELDALPELTEPDQQPPIAPRTGPSPRTSRSTGGDTPEDAVRNLLSNEDPATLARAIRTSLKKDEKG